MKRHVVLLLAVLSASAAEKSDLRLANGDVLKAARIVAIQGDTVTIVYAEGTRSAHAEDVPLDVLARAHMDLEAKKKAAANASKAPKTAPPDAAEKQAREDEIKFRLALAKAREQAPAPSAPGGNIGDLTQEQKLLSLKSQFPQKRRDRVTVGIGRRNARYVTRTDTLDIDVPHGDVWTWYRGMVQTTTIQALPRTLRLIDERIARDVAELSRRGSSSDEAATAQSSRTLAWIQEDLQSYLAELRDLVR